MTAATFSFGAWHRRQSAPANGSMSHSQGDRFMFRKWLMATAAVLFIGGGIAAATNNYWLRSYVQSALFGDLAYRETPGLCCRRRS